MSTRPSFRAEWKARFDRDLESYPALLAMDSFRNWERNASPDGSAQDILLDALRVLYAHTGSDIWPVLLEQVLSVVTRTRQEGKLQSKECAALAPMNHGRLLRTMSYARFLAGGPIDTQALREASVAFEAWALEKLTDHWDSQAQAYYLAAIRLSLIADDPETARRLLATRKSLKWHPREVAVLKALATRPPQDAPRDQQLLSELESYFDEVRRPGYESRVFIEGFILPLELGILRDKHFVSADGAVDWSRVVDAVSE